MSRPPLLNYKHSVILSLLFCLLCFSPLQASQDEPLIGNGGYLVVAQSGEILGSYNADSTYVPASILKIVTSLYALENIGLSYRFPTYFFMTERNDLYIAGTGDPYLISEEIDTIVTAFKDRNIETIRNIYIDNSTYALTTKTINPDISNNPYDTPLSAVGVNFNTIQIKILNNHDIISGEPQTPTLPIMLVKGKGLVTGEHRINLGTSSKDIVRYAGQLFKYKFIQNSIQVTGKIEQGKTPEKAVLIYTHFSKPLPELLAPMLLYSNNFMANQIYLKNGVKQFGYPATWEKAAKAMQLFLQKNLLVTQPLQIQDGAGLSRKNQISCETMIRVLQRFRKYKHLLPLKEQIPLKSGTMEGIYSYAGYLGTKKDAPAFVLMLNQKVNNRDKLLKQLLKQYAPSSKK